MLTTISQKFHAWTTGWRVLLLFIAEALMAGYVMPLDLMFFYTPETAFDTIERYGEAGTCT